MTENFKVSKFSYFPCPMILKLLIFLYFPYPKISLPLINTHFSAGSFGLLNTIYWTKHQQNQTHQKRNYLENFLFNFKILK